MTTQWRCTNCGKMIPLHESPGHVCSRAQIVAGLERSLEDQIERNQKLQEQCYALKCALLVSLQAEKQMSENLTNVQARCTELFVENRRLRGVEDEITCIICKHVERLAPKDGKFNEQLAIYRGWHKTEEGWICGISH